MVNLLSNKSFDRKWLDGVKNLLELEKLLFKLVIEYKGTTDERLKVFHLIQIWGGVSGRNFYLNPETGFNWNNLDERYKEFVDACSKIEGHTETDFVSAYTAVINLSKKVDYLGPSFATKHLRFWCYPKLKEWTFPPYDSVLASEYMKKKGLRYSDIIPYWKRIYTEAAEKKSNVMEYERQLFNLYHKDKKDKKK